MPLWKCVLFCTGWYGTHYGQVRKLFCKVEELRITKGRVLFDCVFSGSLSIGYFVALVGRSTLRVVIHVQICLVQKRK